MRGPWWGVEPGPARAAAYGRGRRRTFSQVHGCRGSRARLSWQALASIPQTRQGSQGVDESLQGRAGPSRPRRVLLPLRRRPLLDSAPCPRQGAGGIGRRGLGGLRAHNGRTGTIPLPRARTAPGRLDRIAVLVVLPFQRLEERVLRRERPRSRLGEGLHLPLRVGGWGGKP